MRYRPIMGSAQHNSVFEIGPKRCFRVAVGVTIFLLSACGPDSLGAYPSQESVATASIDAAAGGVPSGLTSVKFNATTRFSVAATSGTRLMHRRTTDLEGHRSWLTQSRLCVSFVQRTSAPYRLCDKGFEIRQLQQILYEYGLLVPEDSNPVDGYFGSTTEEAVKAYQRQAGLPVNGVVEATWYRKLLDDYKRGRSSANPATTVPRSGQSGSSSGGQGSCSFTRNGASMRASNGSKKTFSDGVNECRDGSWVLIEPRRQASKTLVDQVCSVRATGLSSSWHGAQYSYTIYDVWSDGSKTIRKMGFGYLDQIPLICW